MTKEELKALIKKDDNWAVGCLLTIYNNQQADEQAYGATVHRNDIGFNGTDAGFMTSLAKKYLQWGKLTDRQMYYVRKNMLKYANQCLAYGATPAEVKTTTKPKAKRQRVIEFVDLKENTLEIRFQYPRGNPKFNATLDFVKGLENRKWDKLTKKWSVPASLQAIEDLRKYGFKATKPVIDWYKKHQYKTVKIKNIPGLPFPLRPYQHEGVEYVDSRNGRALIADEMGLGKTVQCLAYLQLHKETRPALIVCPASLKANWVKEAKKWLPGDNIYSISGRWSKSKPVPNKGVIIINYDILPGKFKKVIDKKTNKKKLVETRNTGWADALEKIKPQFIAYDEIQYIKNLQNQRGIVCKRLTKKIPKVLGLSGTPIENRPSEFFNPISLINPTIFPNWWNYMQTYCGAKHNGFGWDFTGATNIHELHKKLKKTIMIRRLKKDVLKELPEKNRMVVTLDLNNRKEYNRADQDIIKYLAETKGPEAAEKAQNAETLVSIEVLKQLAIQGKIKACIEWIENYLKDNDKLVVGCTHQETIQALMKHFGKQAVEIQGSTSLKKRNKNVELFQNSPATRLLVGNLKAAGVGLTLTAANATATIEFGWKPADHVQFEDRVHRIGQEADSVFAYYLVAENTIEESIAKLLDIKMQVLTGVLDGEDVEEINLLELLINMEKERKKEK